MIKPDDLVHVGTLTAPHGIRGQLKLTSHTEQPEGIAAFSALYSRDGLKTYAIKLRGMAKQQLLVEVVGCTSRNDAELLRNTELYAKRSEFPEVSDDDSFYITDLIGLEVRDTENNVVGRVKEVHDFGAGDILEIAPLQGASFMVMFTEATIPTIDIEAGYLLYCPPDIIGAKV